MASSVLALPQTTIEKTYYATAAKEQIVGYFYQGCIASSTVSWGIRTNYHDTKQLQHGCEFDGPDSHTDTSGLLKESNMTTYDERVNTRGACVLHGITDEIRNDGEVSLLDYESIKSLC